MSNINIIVTLAAQCHPQTRRLACPTTKQGLDTFYYMYENRGLIIPMRLHIDGAMAYTDDNVVCLATTMTAWLMSTGSSCPS